jgi:hypothetical protein
MGSGIEPSTRLYRARMDTACRVVVVFCTMPNRSAIFGILMQNGFQSRTARCGLEVYVENVYRRTRPNIGNVEHLYWV